MKTPLLFATAVLAFSTLPAMSAESSDNENAQKIKALEAEIDALRAQLRAEGRIRGEDRNRDGDRGREHDGPGSRGMHEEQRRVMHFDLGDMSEGEIEGEVHIEIMGDMEGVPHFVREMVMEQMGRGEEGMHDVHIDIDMDEEDMREMFMHMDEDEMHEVFMFMDDDGRHDFFMEMDEEEMRRGGNRFRGPGGPPMGQRDWDPRNMEPPHMDRGEEDPFFREGSEFVGKMEMTSMIADQLGDPMKVAIFGVWEARQHLEPGERLEILFPIMQDDAIALPVRNAAAMVVRESLVELGDFDQARAVLGMQIRINGSMN